jgi:signal transduction histidine kinase
MDAGGARQRRGSGLGLYLVKLASEAHGGIASVEDRVAGGAVFRIKLPRVAS